MYKRDHKNPFEKITVCDGTRIDADKHGFLKVNRIRVNPRSSVSEFAFSDSGSFAGEELWGKQKAKFWLKG